MDTEMSTKTKDEVMGKLRRRYARAGRGYRQQMIDEAVALFRVPPQGGDPRVGGEGEKGGDADRAGATAGV